MSVGRGYHVARTIAIKSTLKYFKKKLEEEKSLPIIMPS